MYRAAYSHDKNNHNRYGKTGLPEPAHHCTIHLCTGGIAGRYVFQATARDIPDTEHGRQCHLLRLPVGFWCAAVQGTRQIKIYAVGVDRPTLQHTHARHDEGRQNAAADTAAENIKGLPLYQTPDAAHFPAQNGGGLKRRRHHCGIDDHLLLHCHTASRVGCQQQY